MSHGGRRSQRRRVSGCRKGTRRGAGAKGAGVAALKQSASVPFGGGGSLAHLKAGSGGRVGRADELSELGVRQLGITVSVDASHNGEQLSLAGVVANVSEEGAKVEGVDPSIVVAVDAAVGSKGREVVANLNLTLQDVKTAHQVDFLLEDIEEGALDIVGQAIEAADTVRGTVEGDVSEQVVRAGQKHLKEAGIGE